MKLNLSPDDQAKVDAEIREGGGWLIIIGCLFLVFFFGLLFLALLGRLLVG